MGSTLARRIRQTVVVLSGLALLSVFAMPFLLIWDLSQRNFEPRSVENPSERFTQLTGLAWPESAKVVEAQDDHGGLTGDGTLTIVFDAEPEEVRKWRSLKPPWGGEDWKEGEPPEDFRNTRTPGIAVASEATMFCAQDFMMSSIPWHNGRTLMVDLKSGRVELIWWDM